MDIQEGDPAPEIDLPSTDGSTMTVASMRGRRFILYFYPKDFTGG